MSVKTGLPEVYKTPQFEDLDRRLHAAAARMVEANTGLLELRLIESDDATRDALRAVAREATADRDLAVDQIASLPDDQKPVYSASGLWALLVNELIRLLKNYEAEAAAMRRRAAENLINFIAWDARGYERLSELIFLHRCELAIIADPEAQLASLPALLGELDEFRTKQIEWVLTQASQLGWSSPSAPDPSSLSKLTARAEFLTGSLWETLRWVNETIASWPICYDEAQADLALRLEEDGIVLE